MNECNELKMIKYWPFCFLISSRAFPDVQIDQASVTPESPLGMSLPARGCRVVWLWTDTQSAAAQPLVPPPCKMSERIQQHLEGTWNPTINFAK